MTRLWKTQNWTRGQHMAQGAILEGFRGQRSAGASSDWLWRTDYMQIFPPSVTLQIRVPPPPPELVVKHLAAHHPAYPQVRSSMTVCLNRHWGEESILWPSRGKEKQVQRPWSRVPGKPRKTRHSVLKRTTELFCYRTVVIYSNSSK